MMIYTDQIITNSRVLWWRIVILEEGRSVCGREYLTLVEDLQICFKSFLNSDHPRVMTLKVNIFFIFLPFWSQDLHLVQGDLKLTIPGWPQPSGSAPASAFQVLRF